MPVSPHDVHEVLGRHILADGYAQVLDLDRSRGVVFHDARTGCDFIDMFSHYASMPLGYNHPGLTDPAFVNTIGRAALHRPANSDVYTAEYAAFVETFARIVPETHRDHLFFIDGGSPAVENAMKVAFDWKVLKNRRKGVRGEVGTKIIHLRGAFHGRTGYCVSVTNTDPTKIEGFPKFDWPRVSAPAVRFPFDAAARADVEAREAQSLSEIVRALDEHGDDIAGLLIEPIQGEGGDNHFRREYLNALRTLADERDFLLLFDEVQTGFGATGRFWAAEALDVMPDVIAFAKRAQVGGIAVSRRIDDVPDNVFQRSSRISSTWGGNLCDMVRSRRIIEIIHAESILAHVADVGAYLVQRLETLCAEMPHVFSGARGRGLFSAVDAPDRVFRQRLLDELEKRFIIVLGCGERTVRFRPAFVVKREHIDITIDALRAAARALGA